MTNYLQGALQSAEPCTGDILQNYSTNKQDEKSMDTVLKYFILVGNGKLSEMNAWFSEADGTLGLKLYTEQYIVYLEF